MKGKFRGGNNLLGSALLEVLMKKMVALLLIVGLSMVAAMFGGLGDRLILWPQAGKINVNGATRTELPQREGKGLLEVWMAGAPEASAHAFVLRFYGNADRADRWIASEAASFGPAPVRFWGVNYPGYGGSTGPATLAAVAKAALLAYDALAQIAHGRPIYIFGTSLGTTAALHVAAERSVAGLVLQNPPALKQLVLGSYGWWNLWLLAGPVAWRLPRELDSLVNAHRSSCPAIFLLAERDTVVPPRYQRQVVAAYVGKKTVIVQRGADHNTPLTDTEHHAYHQAVEELWRKPTVTKE
jgi:uncharacterized protein